MTEELKKKLTDAGVLEEVEAMVSENSSLAVESAMGDYAESDDFKALLKKENESGYQRGYRVGVKKKDEPNSEEEKSSPDCFGSYETTFKKTPKVCRTCPFAQECKKEKKGKK